MKKSLLITLLTLSHLWISQTQAITVNYTYDDLNRLTDVSYSTGANLHYTYDAAGNMLKKQTESNNPGTLQFNADTYSVDENSQTITINVTRANGDTGAVTVDYASTDDTATAGNDYITASGTLNWDNGDATAKSFAVTILDDNTLEINETLYLSLGNVTGGAILGIPNTVALTIIDNDFGPPIKNDVIIDFGPSYGIYVRLNNNSWVQLHRLSPNSMLAGNLDGNAQDEVIIDFGTGYGIWLWMNNSAWVQLHTISPESLITGDLDGNAQDDVIIDFGSAYGIYLWMNNNAWVQLHSLSPENMITGDIDGSDQDDVIIDFGSGNGIWLRMNNSTWIKLHSLSSESLISGDIDDSGQDDVIIDFGSDYGIWQWLNNSAWVQLHTISPESMVMGDLDDNDQDDVIIDFGTGYGIWLRMNNSAWVKLHSLSPESMVTGDTDSNGQDDVIIDFGSDYGIWQWLNNSTWEKLHTISPESMVTGNLDGLSFAIGSDTATSIQGPTVQDNIQSLPDAVLP